MKKKGPGASLGSCLTFSCHVSFNLEHFFGSSVFHDLEYKALILQDAP